MSSSDSDSAFSAETHHKPLSATVIVEHNPRHCCGKFVAKLGVLGSVTLLAAVIAVLFAYAAQAVPGSIASLWGSASAPSSAYDQVLDSLNEAADFGHAAAGGDASAATTAQLAEALASIGTLRNALREHAKVTAAALAERALTSQAADFGASLADMQNTVAALEARVEGLHEARRVLEVKVEDAEATSAALSAGLVSMNATVASLSTNMQSLEPRVAALESSVQQLSKSVAGHTSELQQLAARVDSQGDALAAGAATAGSASAGSAGPCDCASELHGVRAGMAKLNSTVTRAAEDAVTAWQVASDMSSAMDELDKRQSASSETIAEHTRQLASVASAQPAASSMTGQQEAMLTAEVEALAAKAGQAQVAADGAANDVSSLREELGSVREELASLQTAVAEASARGGAKPSSLRDSTCLAIGCGSN